MYMKNRKRLRQRRKKERQIQKESAMREREKRDMKNKDRLEKTESKSLRDGGGRLGHKLSNLLRCKTFDHPRIKPVQM